MHATENDELILCFDNKEKKLFDAKPILSFSRARELRDPTEEKKVRVSFDALEWETGLDLNPEYLYERSKRIA